MKKENLSTRAQLEIIIEEIQVLQKSTEVLKSFFSILDKKLSEFENIEVSLNNEDVKDFKSTMITNREQMESILVRMRQQAAKYIAIPRYLVISFIVAFLITFLSTGLMFYFKNEAKEWKASNGVWYERAIELGYKSN